MYPHLQDIKESAVNQFNIKEKLINMDLNKDKNISIENLNSFFPIFQRRIQPGERRTAT